MRPIDADLAKEQIKKSDLLNREKIALLLCLSSIPTIAPLPIAPLTMEELREMEGKPVPIWCDKVNGYVFIAVTKTEPYNQVWFFNHKGRADAILYHHANFYRRKPEE